MSEQNDYQTLIMRAVSDADFRRELLQDPEATIARAGYAIPADVLEKLKTIDPAAAEAAANDVDRNITDLKAAM